MLRIVSAKSSPDTLERAAEVLKKWPECIVSFDLILYYGISVTKKMQRRNYKKGEIKLLSV
jgi:hypothetical protein